MRYLSLLAAGVAVIGTSISAPARAADYFVTISGVPATGTRTIAFDNSTQCPTPSGICPDIVTPYETTVSGNLGILTTTGTFNPNGVFNFTGQDRIASAFSGTLTFSNGSLITSLLSGFVQLSAPTARPYDSADFAASNFAVTLRNTVTGESRIFAPVPEPSTWALMLLGFGGIGVAMRRRRSPAGALSAA